MKSDLNTHDKNPVGKPQGEGGTKTDFPREKAEDFSFQTDVMGGGKGGTTLRGENSAARV